MPPTPSQRRSAGSGIRPVLVGTLSVVIPILSASGAAGQVPTPETSPTESPAPPPPSPEPPPSPAPAPEPPPNASASVGGKQGGEAWAAKDEGGSRSRPRSRPQRHGTRLLPDTCARLAGVAAPGWGGPSSTTGLEGILSRSPGGEATMTSFLRVAGPFPVAGPAWWTNDWHVRRCEPYPHLHAGLDIFADAGTPVVATADGRVSQNTNHAIAGLSVEIDDEHGMQFFYAHLSRIAQGVSVGARVEVGDVLGFVGDTGNARGGLPHLHLEIQPGGVPVPPKPYVDRWLETAERRARRLVREGVRTNASWRTPRDEGP